MRQPEELEHLLKDWIARLDPEAREPIDRELVHKHRPENVFVGRTARALGESEDRFFVELILPSDHPFFFEHPFDHVPGLMLVEAGRQAGTAIAHQHYNVAMDSVFVLDRVEVEFSRFATLEDPVCVISSVEDRVIRKGELRGMTHAGTYYQNGEPVAHMSGRWQMVPLRLFKRSGSGPP